MIRDGLLALGLLLSSATQFRVPGLPLGPGEALLLIWMLFAGVEAMLNRAPPMTPALSRLLIFWAIFTIAQSVGLFVGLAIEDYRDNAGAVRTAAAYMLVAILSFLVVILPGWRLFRIAWLVAGFGAAAVTILIAAGYGLVPVPGLHFWIFSRFIGWSMNPNQFSLLCTVLVLLSLYLAETEARPRRKLLALTCIAPAFLAGTITLSDSFILAVLLAGPLFVGTKFLSSVFLAERRPSLATTTACLLLISIPALIAAAAPFAPRLLDHARQMAVKTMEQNDQAAGRFQLWSEATEIGLNSGMLGLGPGPHLVGSRQWKLQPPEKGEAHNTFFELLTQGGMVAALCFLWITAAAFLAAYRARLLALASLVFSLFIFSNFHHILRHPLFWFSIAFCLAALDGVDRASNRRARPRRAPPDRPLLPLPAQATLRNSAYGAIGAPEEPHSRKSPSPAGCGG